MIQIVFNEISAAEMANLPKELQLELLAEFDVLPEEIDEFQKLHPDRFGVLERDGQRLHRYADYLAVLAARGMSPASFEGYLEAFRHGMPPHGGFAIGLERWVARLVEAPNIRETTLFPRDLTRLTP